MKALLSVLCMFAASVAFGQTTTIGAAAGSQSGSESTSASGAIAGSRSASGAVSNQQQQSTAQQAQDASNTNTVSPSQVVNNNGSPIPASTTQQVNYSGTTTQRSAPAVVGPVMNPTTPCTSVISAGGSGIGFGVFIGSTMEDKECTRREFARVLIAVGQMDAGMSVLCGNEMVAKAAPALCKKVQTALGSTDMLPVVASSTTSAPATVQTTTAPEPVKSAGPRAGQVEKGSDGKSYRFNGSGWVPITNDEVPAAPRIHTTQVN